MASPRVRYSGRRRGPVPEHSSGRNKVGAVVIRGDYQGLGIARSLGHRGVPVCVVDDEPSIAPFSRYATHAVRVDDLGEGKATAEVLLDVGRRLGLEGWVLYPTDDAIVTSLSQHRTILETQYRVPTPGWSAIQWAADKRKTYSLAEELGIPVPRTWYLRDARELDQVDADPPLAIKPAIKSNFIQATKAKAWRADTRAELVELFGRAAAIVGPGEVMVQELIPGDGRQQFAYCTFFKEGNAIGTMVACRRRQHPLEFGRASTFVETVDCPQLEIFSERFLRKIDYYGLAELEFKLDSRDGHYKLLDVNTRHWGYHTLGERAGVNFSYLVFADQTGQSVTPCRTRSGIRWSRLVTDVPTGILEMAAGRSSWRSYVASLRGCHTEAVFSREDPLPGAVELAMLPYLAVNRGF